MRAEDVKEIAERTPFRPFIVKLDTGMTYRFERPRDFGAPESCRMIFCFANNQAVRIDAGSISEIVEA
jgi:hypothetical protein